MAGIKGVMRGLVLGCATLAASGTAHAAESADKYPSHPVRWIVAYPPAGTTDIVARLMLGRSMSTISIASGASASSRIG